MVAKGYATITTQDVDGYTVKAFTKKYSHLNKLRQNMFKVIYSIDTLDPKPDVTFFDTEEEAYDYVQDEIERRVSFQVSHSPLL